MQIDSVASYLKYVLEVSVGPDLLYRGLPNRAFELIPSIGRHTKRPDGELFSREYILGRELEVLAAFRDTSVAFREHRDITQLETMVLAQHHGVPTRLLDWTFNPLIALYFAVQDVVKSNDGIVYIHEPPTPLAAIRDGWRQPLDIGVDVYFVPQHIDRRIAAQASIFTLHAEPTIPMNKEGIKYVWFKGEHKELLLSELDVVGIHAASVFPGLGGIAGRLRNKSFGIYS